MTRLGRGGDIGEQGGDIGPGVENGGGTSGQEWRTGGGDIGPGVENGRGGTVHLVLSQASDSTSTAAPV